MGTPQLTERDETVLDALRDGGPATAASLAAAAGTDEDNLAARLRRLADAGLVVRDPEAEGEAAYVLTADGRRALDAPGDGRADEEIETTGEVERALDSLDLRADREGAVRRAFAFLDHWGDATAAELREALYEECPAGYDTPDEWWTDCVEPGLASLPGVTRPEFGPYWRSEGGDEGDDGRRMLDADADGGADASGDRNARAERSVRRAVSELDCSTPERDAVRAAFALLYERSELPPETFAEEVYPNHDAGYDSADGWWRAVSERLASLPGVVPPETGDGGGDEEDGRWRYEA